MVNKPLKILICGGRDFGHSSDERKFIFNTLDMLVPDNKEIIIIHGACRGVDMYADNWSDAYYPRIICWQFPAEWKKYGRSAGFIRNKQMLEEGKPDWVVSFPGGPGTKMMTDLARKSGIRVRKIEYPYTEIGKLYV